MSRSRIIVEQIHGWLALIFGKQLQSSEAREGVLASVAHFFSIIICEVTVVPATVSLFWRLHILLAKWLGKEAWEAWHLGLVTAIFFTVAFVFQPPGRFTRMLQSKCARGACGPDVVTPTAA